MDFEYVSIERKGRVAVVRFDREDGVNALSRDLKRELIDAARAFEDDTETSAIVLAGAADVFTLGFDLKDPTNADVLAAGLAERRQITQLGPRLCRAWEDLEPMTFVAIEGWCVGGGAALAVACDIRVMGEGGTLYVPEIERGMNMSWQSVPRTVNLVGTARTKRMFALAEKIDAETALDWGLADKVTLDGAALEGATQFAQRAAELPPVPLRMIKQGVNGAANATSHAASFMDADQNLLNRFSEDFEEGVQSFLEKRPPRYTGR
jgi:enoyl-CoA hydratase/carnithine racemase